MEGKRPIEQIETEVADLERKVSGRVVEIQSKGIFEKVTNIVSLAPHTKENWNLIRRSESMGSQINLGIGVLHLFSRRLVDYADASWSQYMYCTELYRIGPFTNRVVSVFGGGLTDMVGRSFEELRLNAKYAEWRLSVLGRSLSGGISLYVPDEWEKRVEELQNPETYTEYVSKLLEKAAIDIDDARRKKREQTNSQKMARLKEEKRYSLEFREKDLKLRCKNLSIK